MTKRMAMLAETNLGSEFGAARQPTLESNVEFRKVVSSSFFCTDAQDIESNYKLASTRGYQEDGSRNGRATEKDDPKDTSRRRLQP